MKIEIKHRWTGNTLFAGEFDSLGLAVLAAIAQSADLRSANLGGADLRSADLRSADLRSADLGGADLRSANLGGADLRSADLRSADLGGADLRSANLSPAAGSFSPGYSIGFQPDPTLALRVAKAALGEGALDMGTWHRCDTTHCLAGWAVHLSGPAGYALEKLTSPSVAGAILCPDVSHLFFAGNDTALEWCREQVAKAEPASVPAA